MHTFVEKYQTAKQEIETAKQILEFNSILFKPEISNLKVNWDTVQYPVYEPTSFPLEMNDSEVTLSTFKTIPLDVLLTYAKTDELSQMVHIYVKLGDDKIGYAISKEGAKRMPKERLAKILADELTKQLHGKF